MSGLACLWIEGGARLEGSVEAPPAKNAALPLLALSLMTSHEVRFRSLPNVADIQSMIALLESLGVKQTGASAFRASSISSVVAPYDLVRKMRASILVLGALLAREGKAEVSLPGGCAIGERPVDIHLEGLRALGAKIQIENGYIKAEASKLRGTRFVLNFPTVTGTMNILMAACLAEGQTILENVACEPEVTEVAQALNQMGAKITGFGSSTLQIQGVSSLQGLEWDILPDRIQLLTYLAAGAITGGDITCRPYRMQTLNAVLQKFREMGCQVSEEEGMVRLRRDQPMKPVQFDTAPFPGFPTDGQAQLVACLSVADPSLGPSLVRELVFEKRFQHVPELRRMGAQIELKGDTAIIHGVKQLSGTTVMASDLRASASLVLAGLVAQNRTQVLRVYHLDRGYENFEQNLSRVGARIWRANQ